MLRKQTLLSRGLILPRPHNFSPRRPGLPRHLHPNRHLPSPYPRLRRPRQQRMLRNHPRPLRSLIRLPNLSLNPRLRNRQRHPSGPSMTGPLGRNLTRAVFAERL